MRMRNSMMAAVAILALSAGGVGAQGIPVIDKTAILRWASQLEAMKEQFDALNDELRENAKNANTFANILMPIMMNIGNLLYVLVAITVVILIRVVGIILVIALLTAPPAIAKQFSIQAEYFELNNPI